MLDRVLEPEVMDSREDADEYEAIDNSSVNEEFVARALELAPPAGQLVDLGTGPGDIAILLARAAPEMRVIAIDLGEHMLGRARARVRRAGLGQRVKVLRADAKSTGLAEASVDMVISNSLIHHIAEPIRVFAEIKRIARAGAAIFIKDLHRPRSEAEHLHLVETYAKDCTPYQRRLFSESLRAGLTASEVEDICRCLDLPNVKVCRCSDRHWSVERPAGLRSSN
jgi:ubiquinone/menaquinone biosynthesis C-methylase UbiE